MKCPNCNTENPKLISQCMVEGLRFSEFFTTDNIGILKPNIKVLNNIDDVNIYTNYLWCYHCRCGVTIRNEKLIKYEELYNKSSMKGGNKVKNMSVKEMLTKVDHKTLAEVLIKLKNNNA